MCSILVPAALLNITPSKWFTEPLPAEPKVRGLFLSPLGQLFHAFEVGVRTSDQDKRQGGQGGHRGKVFDRIKGQFFVQRGIDGVRAHIAHEQHMAIGRRLRYHLHAHVATSACTVFNHHRLLPFLAELLADDARQCIRGAAGCLRHDDFDGAGRKVLRQDAERRKHKSGYQTQAAVA